MRLGMIGLDTSHSVEFASRLNHPGRSGHVPGGRITVAVQTSSSDMPMSLDRVAAFSREMREEHGVKLVQSVDEMLAECDAVLLCSLDGRPHPAQFRTCAVGKPVFVDKPVAASLRDAAEIYRIAEQTRTPVFSASALRFVPEVIEVSLAEVGRVAGAVSQGPCPLEPHHPDLFFYGIHAVEALFTVMGPGCVRVSRVTTERASVVTGVWTDGSIGTLQALHHWPAPYAVTKMGDRGVVSRGAPADYAPLLREVVRFCQTGHPPVSPAQTLEICAFMEAADASRRRDGRAVALEEVRAAAAH
jgi:hypothetical protein